MNYRLKKDLPNLKVGAIFTEVVKDIYCNGNYFSESTNDNPIIRFTKEEIEKKTDWFVPLPELTEDKKKFEFKDPFEWTTGLVEILLKQYSTDVGQAGIDVKSIVGAFKKRTGYPLSEKDKSARQYPLTPDDMEPKTLKAELIK